MLWIIRLVALAAFLGCIAGVVLSLKNRFDDDETTKPFPILPLVIGGVFAFLFLGLSISATNVPGNNRAVVLNSLNGNYSTLGPGIHFWPLDPSLVPFASKVTLYDLKQTRIEIGKPQVEDGDDPQDVRPTVAAASDSPGEPPVFFWAAGWAAPNPDNDALIELHKRYGENWADSWVEANWQETIKARQGQYPLDYVSNNREQFSDEVEDSLNKQLVGLDRSTQLVTVDQIAIVNYDYNKTTNERLEALAASENERRLAVQAQEIANANADREAIEAETRLTVATKDAETEIARARGEAEAIRITNDAIASQGSGYLLLKWIEKWDGKLPITSLGDANDFMLNLGNQLAGADPAQG